MTSSKRIFAALSLLLIFASAGFVGGPANEIERSIMTAAAALRSSIPWVAGAASILTMLGGFPFTIGVAVVGSLTLLARRELGRALLLLATVLLVRLLVEGLKDWIGRVRPLADQLPDSLAFPSGHSANSMTAYVAVALIAVPAHHRRTAALGAVALSIIVGITRIILGVHWPSDVLGGWTLGMLAVGTAVLVGEKSGVLSLEAQHEIVGGHLAPAREDKTA
jgi:undecaprenyl-diphosphatase